MSALKSVGIPKPSVNLPAVPKNELEWLDYEQIERLLKVVRGQRVELAVILALHSLRLSELLALTMDDIYDDSIHVRSARVRDKNNLCITKAMTKTAESTRTIHFLIPRIKEILPVSGRLVDYNQNSLYRAINRACREAQVPEVGVHGLRRSFASLAYHLGWSERSIMRVGGWSNINTMHNVYIKLAEKDVAADAAKMYDYYEFTTDSP